MDQVSIRGTQHAKMKAEPQEKLQILEQTTEALEDNENKMEDENGKRRKATAKNTTDN